MKMRDRLASRLAGVEANVVAVGMELRVELLLDDLEQIDNCGPLLWGRREPSIDEPPRDDQRMTRTPGEGPGPSTLNVPAWLSGGGIERPFEARCNVAYHRFPSRPQPTYR